MLTLEKINRQSEKLIDKTIVLLWDSGGILPLSEIHKSLNIQSDSVRKNLDRDIRRCYYIDRSKSRSAPILILNIMGRDDSRHYDNPYNAISISAFVFSLLCQDRELTHRTAIPAILHYKNLTGNSIGNILTNENFFYSLKKEVNKYLDK